MAKKTDERDEPALAAAQIRETPTASDAQVAAATGVDRYVVADVRAGMGAKHTWPKPKKEKSE